MVQVIPGKLAKILIGLVVVSMALTPLLSTVGDKLASYLEDEDKSSLLQTAAMNLEENSSDEDVVVICGFGNVGENIMKIMKSVIANMDGNAKFRCLAFSLDPTLVVNGYKNGYDILYGDGSQPNVLTTAGIDVARTKAFVVTYTDSNSCLNAVKKLRIAYPNTPIISRSREFAFSERLYAAGATTVITDEKESTVKLSQSLLRSLGVASIDPLILLDSGGEDATIAARLVAFNNEKLGDTIDDIDKLKRSIRPDFDMSISTSVSSVANSYSGNMGATDIVEGDTVEATEAEGVTTCALPPRQ
jgi:TrkA-N domain